MLGALVFHLSSSGLEGFPFAVVKARRRKRTSSLLAYQRHTYPPCCGLGMPPCSPCDQLLCIRLIPARCPLGWWSLLRLGTPTDGTNTSSVFAPVSSKHPQAHQYAYETCVLYGTLPLCPSLLAPLSVPHVACSFAAVGALLTALFRSSSLQVSSLFISCSPAAGRTLLTPSLTRTSRRPLQSAAGRGA